MNLANIKNSSTLTIIVTNVLFLIAVFIFRWDPLSVFVLYILETVIVGILHIIKLFTLTFINSFTRYKIEEAASFGGLIGTVIFFIIHFGMFVFVQTVLILPSQGHSFIKTFLSLQNYLVGDNLWFLAAIAVINLLAVIRYIFIDNAYEGKAFNDILMEPYPRIFVQQFVVIFGGGFIMALGLGGIGGLIFIVFFILMKTLFELLAASGDMFKSTKQY